MRTNSIFFICFLLMSTVYLVSCGGDDDPTDPMVSCEDLDATYDGDVRAIINTCANASCHGGSNVNIPEESRDFTSFAGLNAVTSSGKLITRTITNADMPPSGALSQANMDLLQCWADAGYPEN